MMQSNHEERAALIATLDTLDNLLYSTPVRSHGAILEDAARLVALRLADVLAGVASRDADQAARFYASRGEHNGARMTIAAEAEAAKR